MSVEQFVLLAEADLPAVEAVQQRAQLLGHALDLEESNLRTHTGYLPAHLDGIETGFETYCGPVSDLDLPPDGIDARLTFFCATVTGSGVREGLAATVFLRAVQDLSRGGYWYPDDDMFRPPDQAGAYLDSAIAGLVALMRRGR